MAGEFVHMELNTPELEKSKAFYGGLFGWEFQDIPMGDGTIYSMFKPQNGPGGGLMTVPDAPMRWLNYVGVQDVKAATAKARELGATVWVETMEVTGRGWFSIMEDPTGAAIAIWQDA